MAFNWDTSRYEQIWHQSKEQMLSGLMDIGRSLDGVTQAVNRQRCAYERLHSTPVGPDTPTRVKVVPAGCLHMRITQVTADGDWTLGTEHHTLAFGVAGTQTVDVYYKPEEVIWVTTSAGNVVLTAVVELR